ERDVVVGRRRRLVAGERRCSRHRGGRGRALRAAHELDALGDDFGHRPLLAVLALPVPRLQASFDEHLTTLVEVLAAALCLLAPHHDREEAGFLALFATLRRVISIDRHAEIGHRRSARGVAQLRGTGQIADQQDLVEARHQTTSSSTSGCGLLGRRFFRIGRRVERKRSTFSLSRSWRSNSWFIYGSADTSQTTHLPSHPLRFTYLITTS